MAEPRLLNSAPSVMKVFETIVKILGSAWGVWSIVAFAFGIFFWITSAVIKKAKISTLAPRDSYRFLRLATVLAFVLAIAALITGFTREWGKSGPAGESKQERIQRLVRDLKNEDPTIRRQAAEALVPYGGDASKELVRAISEESGVVAADMFGRVTRGDLTDLFSQLLGAPPWQTPFMSTATDTLVQIGQPSVAPVLEQLATESAGAERILANAAQMSAQQQQQTPNALGSMRQWGFLFGAAGEGLKIGIARETFAEALVGIGEPGVPELIDALESPRFLVARTSYEVLMKLPSATRPVIQKLRELATRTEKAEEREQILAVVRQLEARPIN